MSWHDALELARFAFLVGRERECSVLDEALQVGSSDVLLVTGNVGAGKTSLLRQFAMQARARGFTPQLLELSERATPEARAEVLAQAIALFARAEGRTAPTRLLLLIDTDTALLAGQALTRLLPVLPGTARLVVASPEQPDELRTDQALRRIVRELPLGPLSERDSRALLSANGVPEGCQEALVRFSRGHPLTLVLSGDACIRSGSAHYDPAADATLVSALAARYLHGEAARATRTALYAATLVRTLDEPMLARLLDVDDAYDQFEALRRVPFVQAGHGGLSLDPLARTVLGADLRWRNSDLLATLHRRARAVYAGRLASPYDTDLGAVLSDYLFLLRDNPIVRPFFSLLLNEEGRFVGDAQEGRWRTVTAQPAHYAEIAALVERHEGPESARWAAHWLRGQPGNTIVYLSADDRVAGLLMSLSLDEHGPDPAGDPAVLAARAYLTERAPLREGERATLFRFWLGAETYQDVAPVLGLIFAQTVRHYLTAPRLAVSFLPFSDPHVWGLVMGVAGLHRFSEADYVLDGHHFGVFGQDWRRVPPTDWLDRIARFGLAPELPEAPRPPRRLLDREAFAEAVRQGLRDYTSLEALQKNALLHARIGAERGEGEHPTAALRRLIQEAAEALAGSPRTAKMYRALEATYFDPSPTQEQAAERLDVPFSTYRRHLRAGQEAIIATLWTRELGSPSPERET